MSDIEPLARLINLFGVAVFAAAFLVLIWRGAAWLQKLVTRMADRILDGDGNGGPSIRQAVEASQSASASAESARQAAHEARDLAISADRKSTKALEEIRELRETGCSLRADHDVIIPASRERRRTKVVPEAGKP